MKQIKTNASKPEQAPARFSLDNQPASVIRALDRSIMRRAASYPANTQTHPLSVCAGKPP